MYNFAQCIEGYYILCSFEWLLYTMLTCNIYQFTICSTKRNTNDRAKEHAKKVREEKGRIQVCGFVQALMK